MTTKHIVLVKSLFYLFSMLNANVAYSQNSIFPLHISAYKNSGHTQNYLLQWERPENAVYFKIEASIDKNFSKKQIYYTDQTYLHIQTSTKKTFYFRYQFFGPKGKKDVRYSMVASTTTLTNKKIGPLQQSIKKNLKINKNQLSSIIFYPDIIEQKHLEEKNHIQQMLIFPEKDNFKYSEDIYYEIQIATNPYFTQPKYFYSIKNIFYATLVHSRPYYIRYRIKIVKTQIPLSEFSASNKRVVQCCDNSSVVKKDNEKIGPKLTTFPEKSVEKDFSTNQENIATNTNSPPNKWLSLGAGIDFSNHTQTINNYSDLNFHSLTGPSISFHMGYLINTNYSLNYEFKNVKANIDNTSNNQAQINYSVQNHILDFLWFPNYNHHSKSNWHLRSGIQFHQIPFINVTDFSDNQVSIVKANVLNLSLGGGYEYSLTPKWIGHFFMRFQSPLQIDSTSTLDFDPQLSFDGSLGSVYNMNTNYFLGFYWYGQWHSANYILSDIYSLSGSLQILQSHLEIRAGIWF